MKTIQSHLDFNWGVFNEDKELVCIFADQDAAEEYARNIGCTHTVKEGGDGFYFDYHTDITSKVSAY